MLWEKIKAIFSQHRGKCLGSIVGLLVGLFIMIVGFWWTLFLGLCTYLGFCIGKRFDEDGELTITDVIERYFWTSRHR